MKSFFPNKRLLSIGLAFLLVLMTTMMPIAAKADEDVSFSEEYKGSPYYSRLQTALTESAGLDIMSRVLAIAQSQEGYRDYCMAGTTPEAAREAGYLWTGEDCDGDNASGAGNTEYTRWAQEYVMNRSGNDRYLDCDWCAIFASWCMYQAGYYSDAELKKYFYSYYADPREERTAGSWIEAFNFDHDRVWYTPAAAGKVEAYNWSRYTHTDISPYEIPYKPGGMIFFSWDASGRYFSHVGIVVDYNSETHELTYINGNVDYAVTTRVMDLDADEAYHGQVKTVNANRIMAYAEYVSYSAPQPKEITADKTTFEWVRNSGESLLVKTNTDSKTVLLTADSGFFDSNQTWPAQLILRYGEVTIGAALLDYLPDGDNTITLEFEDGSLMINVKISSPAIGADQTSFSWKRGSDEGITLQTTSNSSTLEVYGDGFTAKSKTGEVSIEDGMVTLTPRLLEHMKNGEGILTLVFSDGCITLHITVYEKEPHVDPKPVILPEAEKKAISADRTAFIWNRKAQESITLQTDSTSGSVVVYGDGATYESKKNEITYRNGKVTLPAKMLRGLKNGEHNLALVFDDGALAIRIRVFEDGWVTENSLRYYFGKDGEKKTGWLSLDGKWYYLDQSGVMQTGWRKDNGKWYYLDPDSGIMATGWRKISGNWYFFKNNGSMTAGEYKSGYWLNHNGTWTYAYKASWHRNSIGWWYGDASGWYARNLTLIIDDTNCIFNSAGYCTYP
ncbi:MAG: CHAP domain-containing protein [Eubacterium sp.]|nr:CHAP domain-containing protein [Eubacterium sp.]